MKCLKIDIWSDVMCPWCVIGYLNLRAALDELAGEIEAEVRWLPFELNPDMPPEGEDMETHILRKFGRKPDPAMTDHMQQMAARSGYAMRWLGEGEEPERRLWNTFAAHRLLRWALETVGSEAQTRLKLALFDAHFQQRRPISDPAVLVDIAASVGLDRAAAQAALADERLAEEVRDEERRARAMGIASVPTVVIDGEVAIPGAHEPARFVRMLRQVAEHGAESLR